MATVRESVGIILAITAGLSLPAVPAYAHGGGHGGGGHGGGGHMGGAPVMRGGGMHMGGMPAARGGYGGGFRGPSISATPRGMNVPRGYAQPGGMRGYAGGIRPGGLAGASGGRAPMAGMPHSGVGGAVMGGRPGAIGSAGHNPYGVGARPGMMTGAGHNPYGVGGRAPMGSMGHLATHNPYSMGAGHPGAGLAGGRAPVGPAGGMAVHHPGGVAASHPGGIGGRAPIAGGRVGNGLVPTSFHRPGLAGNGVAGINRTGNTVLNFGGNRQFMVGHNGIGGAYGAMHQGWLHGRWNPGPGGFGRGWGYGPYGNRGFGYGRYGYGGYGRYGYGGYGRYGYGGFFPGFGFGLGAGLGFGLGYGLLGYGGYGLGGFGLGGYGLGFGYPYFGGYGLGFGGCGLGLGFGGLGYGLGNIGLGYGYGGYGYGYPSYGGYGLSSWMYGPSLYDWGYSSYSNPYGYAVNGSNGGTTVIVESAPYDYNQPINTQADALDPGVTSPALSSFDAARAAFKAGDYNQALNTTDQAIRQMPNDAALHEFRALDLFALQRYDEAAATLYAVLSAGPGWDWATLVGLYPNVSVYTQQLRALEAYCTQNPTSAAARFVLAYHYLTTGHTLAAFDQLKEVGALQPKDTLSSQLARRLEPSTPSSPVGPPALQPPISATAPAPSGREGRLEGTWTARPDANTTISVAIPDPGHFTWTVTQQNQPRQLQGRLTYGNGILTLAQDQGPAMVGNVTWTDENHFTFRVPGAAADDPGLTFSRQP